MCSTLFKFSTVATLGFIGALFMEAAPASAKSIALVDNNGVSAGWTVTVPDAQAAGFNITFVRSSGNQFFFTKDATLTSNNTPFILSFDRTSANAKDLVIQNEAIVNNTGSSWTSFREIVSSGSTSGGSPNFALTTSDGSAGLGNFSIDPFTSFSFVNSNTELDVTGGTVAAGSTWRPGSASSTGLAIMTNDATADHFTLKEISIPGSGGVVIPLPTAAWTGLSTLIGLGIVSKARKIYRRVF
jgi:hypothetical protein